MGLKESIEAYAAEIEAGDIVYRFTPKPSDDITGYDDIADEYIVLREKKADGGLVIYGKHRGEWHANPNARHVVRRLLIELGHM